MTGAGLVIVGVVTGIVLVIAAVAANTPRAVRDWTVAARLRWKTTACPLSSLRVSRPSASGWCRQCDGPGIGRPRGAQVIASLIS
jgi:hypothetical protein